MRKQTIIVEDRLKEVFEYLPELYGNDNAPYKPVFKHGDEKELHAFFKESQGATHYPLIWLVWPYREEHKHRTKVVVSGLELILAVETSSEMNNTERIEKTFKPILYKLLDSILEVFRVGNTVSFDGDFEIQKYGNYSDTEQGEESKFLDLWDAIKLTTNITINDSCLREIKI